MMIFKDKLINKYSTKLLHDYDCLLDEIFELYDPFDEINDFYSDPYLNSLVSDLINGRKLIYSYFFDDYE